MIRRASSVMTSCMAVGLTLIDPRIFWTPFVNFSAGRTTHRYLEIHRYWIEHDRFGAQSGWHAFPSDRATDHDFGHEI